jgi:hypothetical protein
MQNDRCSDQLEICALLWREIFNIIQDIIGTDAALVPVATKVRGE